MHFFKAIVGTVALASTVVAQLTLGITKAPTSVTAGETYTIEYLATDSAPVTLTLRKGASTDLKVVNVLSSGLTTGSYQWSVDKSLVSGDDYAIEITQTGQKSNYYGPFPLTGGAAATSSSSSSSSSSASVNVASVSASSTITSSASLSSAVSSLSSVISAANSTLASLTASNATITSSLPIVTPGSNSSMTLRTSASSTGHASSTDSSVFGSSTATAPTSGAANMASPMALLLGAVAAMVFLN